MATQVKSVVASKELLLLESRLDDKFTVLDEDVLIRASSHLELTVAACSS